MTTTEHQRKSAHTNHLHKNTDAANSTNTRLSSGLSSLVFLSQISGLVFSGSLSTAMSIVGSDFVTKSGFMFAGERLWNKVGGGGGTADDNRAEGGKDRVRCSMQTQRDAASGRPCTRQSGSCMIQSRN